MRNHHNKTRDIKIQAIILTFCILIRFVRQLRDSDKIKCMKSISKYTDEKFR